MSVKMQDKCETDWNPKYYTIHIFMHHHAYMDFSEKAPYVHTLQNDKQHYYIAYLYLYDPLTGYLFAPTNTHKSKVFLLMLLPLLTCFHVLVWTTSKLLLYIASESFKAFSITITGSVTCSTRHLALKFTHNLAGQNIAYAHPCNFSLCYTIFYSLLIKKHNIQMAIIMKIWFVAKFYFLQPNFS